MSLGTMETDGAADAASMHTAATFSGKNTAKSSALSAPQTSLLYVFLTLVGAENVLQKAFK